VRTVTEDLVRVVVDAAAAAGGRFVLRVDAERVLPGRGAHLHPRPDCLELAQRRRAFPRALRVQGPVEVDELARHLSDLDRKLTTADGRPAVTSRRDTDQEAGRVDS